MGKAIQDGCEYVLTYGATQSNHAMQTTWTALSSGLKPILYLVAVVEPDENDIKANMLLDKIYGAEIHIVSMEDNETFMDAERRSFLLGEAHVKKLNEQNHKCMEIPLGGASKEGCVAYINGLVELCEQAEKENIKFDYLYHATASGGTMAGLTAGKMLIGSDIEIHSIAALDMGENYAAHSENLANGALEYIGATALVKKEDFIIDKGFYGEAYEVPTAAGTEAIQFLARNEGLLVDPVYTGKAFSGLLSDIRTGKIKQGSNVVFPHTGGATGLFAEKEILGRIY